MLVKVERKDTQTLVNALIQNACELPAELLTWDRGKKLADRCRFTLATTSRCTFAIHSIHGSAAQTKIPTACSVGTSRKASTCQAIPRPSWTKWLGSSTNDHAGPWALRHRSSDIDKLLR